MKRLLSLICILALALAVLTACSDKGQGEGTADTQNTETKKNNSSKSDSANDNSQKNDAQTNNNTKNNSQNNNTGWGDWNGDWGDWGDWNPNGYDEGGDKEQPENTVKTGIEIDIPKAGVSAANDITDVSLSFRDDGTFTFGQPSTLYSNDLTLTIGVPEGAKVYYTFDGTNPTEQSMPYMSPIIMKTHGGSFPSAYTFRAVAYYEDGRVSNVAARSYLVASKLEGRFTTLIFSVSGDPEELINSPDGIFTEKNYLQRGRESEREVFVEAWKPDGTNLFSQFAGVRIYGGYSRKASIKSMKLFARKSYDPDHKNFKFSEFGTLKLDGSDGIIKKYDKLVLRNGGNDNQFAFIRDELSQTLCKLAGFECYEAVLPAVTYLNGEYYNFYWLHENYSDKYFKEKFGDAEGEFVILEGGEQKKDKDDDPFVQTYVDIYNRKYNEFIKMDMTNEANYKSLCRFMDVESYLDFFAWNIAINNWDWPNNNYKVYRYVEASASVLNAADAVATPDDVHFDGRWRFLVHDMDYTYGLYDQNPTQARYNTLKVVMNENDVRYAPLFTHLMQRKDCRSYFRAKTIEYLEGALSEETIIGVYRALNASREDELEYYYKYIQQCNRKGDSDMWTTSGNYSGNEDQILSFAAARGEYCLRYMDELLPELE